MDKGLIFEGLDQIEIDKIINKKITVAKRLWNQDKKEIVQSDKIEKSENDLFAHDETLAQMVIVMEKQKKEIINYIDMKLFETRHTSEQE